MRLLLDTHAVLWWFNGNPAPSPPARSAIGTDENGVLVSPVSGMEIAIKHRIAKLPEARMLSARLEGMIEHEGFSTLPITLAHALLAGQMTIDHRDPFDRLLIAQARIEGLVLVSNERLFDSTGVSRLW